MQMLTEIFKLLLINLVFLACCTVFLVALGIFKNTAIAVMKRNFVSYFSNPIGYLFLVFFVFVASYYAFCTDDFFASNLATLDQLNKYLPYLMLVYIPSITMGIWSEEKRQGTDELLLTLPVGDFDIVIGKYLAAAATFTISLLFAQIANYVVLLSLSEGDLDTGLFFTTYLGYWLMGMAMIALGMVASYVSSNLTIAFIFGGLLNAPLVIVGALDFALPTASSGVFSRWSMASKLDDFGRGVISFSALVYFGLLIALGFYVCMVLIGKRHWLGGKDGESMVWHYLARTVALVVIILGISYFFNTHDRIRYDATDEKVASLSKDTKRLIRNLDSNRPVRIEAFISAEVPEQYVSTKYNLISLLREFDSASSDITVNIYDNLEPFSKEAEMARERYRIEPQQVRTRTRGAIKDDQIIMGAAFTSGLNKVIVPFFDFGVPVEYELVRSIDTVAQKVRSRLGIVRTDAFLMGGFTGQRMQGKEAIVEELEKQYEVEDVDPSNEIEINKYDVLMVVQPSSLAPPQMTNLIAAIEKGIPTAIFEDPMPAFMSYVTATGEMKRPQGMMGMFGGGQPQPKADIRDLWRALGITSDGTQGFQGFFEPNLVWQQYNPYQKLQLDLPREWVFASDTFPDSINENDQVTKGLAEIFFPIPGFIKLDSNSKLDVTFEPLVETGTQTGVISYRDFRSSGDNPDQLRYLRGDFTHKRYTLAARITRDLDNSDAKTKAADAPEAGESGQPGVSGTEGTAGDEKADEEQTDEEQTDEEQTDEEKTDEEKTDSQDPANAEQPQDEAKQETKKRDKLEVIYVSDIDLMISAFLRIRARPDEDDEVRWRFENVTFLLNIIDSLAGDNQYIDIRKRKQRHSTLKLVERQAQTARDYELDETARFQTAYKKLEEEAQKEAQKAIEEFQKNQEGQSLNIAEVQRVQMQTQLVNRRRDIRLEQQRRERDIKVAKIRRETDLKIQTIQNRYKALALIIPPIPPLIIAIVVFAIRRMREREGISRARLR